MSHFIGVDPGSSGSAVVLTKTGEVKDAIRFKKSSYHEIADFFKRNQEGCMLTIIEKVHAMPGQGVTSMFTFGKATGFLIGCIVSMSLKYEEIHPKEWQKFLSIKKVKKEKKADFKRRMKQEAERLFPNEPIVLENADGYLIAEYARRAFNYG